MKHTKSKPPKRSKWKRYVLYFMVVSVLGGLLTLWIAHEPLPVGEEGDAAEVLADRMLKATNAAAWENVDMVYWEYPRQHKHLWDKKKHQARVEWPEYVAIINTKTGDGVVSKNGEKLTGAAAQEALFSAFGFWTNDSFWLNPISKVRDPGTKRYAVDLDNGKQGLLVQYTSGGITPGDAYLYELDEAGYPINWKFWVEIVPVGGVEFTWEKYEELPGGVWISTFHEGLLLDVEIKNLQAGSKPSDFGYSDDLFFVLGRR